jgi:hypothetical protein
MRPHEFSDYLPETYDPTMTDDRASSSFVWVDGVFHRIPYQSHNNFIANLAGVERPSRVSSQFQYEAEIAFLKAMDRFVAQRGIVKGVFQPGAKSKYSTLKSYLNLEGTPRAIRACYAAFKKNYPDLTIGLDELAYDALGPDGVHLNSKRLEGEQIDRKFGRR